MVICGPTVDLIEKLRIFILKIFIFPDAIKMLTAQYGTNDNESYGVKSDF